MENNNDARIMVNTESEDFSIITNEAGTGFTVDEDKSEHIARSLEKSAIAKLAGNFIPKNLGTRKLVALFNYKEGQPVEVSAKTEVVQVKLTIDLVTPKELPDKLAFNSTQEVEFFIKNETDLDATEIFINTDGLLAITIIEEEPDGNNGYKPVEKTLNIQAFSSRNSEVKLDPSHRFRIKGKVATNELGSKNLKIVVGYKELASLTELDSDKAGAKFEKAINIESISVIRDVVTRLPEKIKLGSKHPVVFQFTNQSAEFSITGISISIEEKEQEKELIE